MAIHPTAVVDPRAEVDPSAEIAAYVVISGPVQIGPQTTVDPFVRLVGQTQIGAECRIHSGAVVGDLPQDVTFAGGQSFCRIGDGVTIREGVTIHRSTLTGSATVVGRGCYLMANSHVGHDCVLGDDVWLVNGALLGGFVQVGSRAVISGNAAVHQFCRIGELAMIGGLAKVTRDIPPFCLADRDGLCVGLNVVGLKRAGLCATDREQLKQAFRLLYRSGLSRTEMLGELERLADSAPLRRLLEFLKVPSRRGLTGARRGRELSAE